MLFDAHTHVHFVPTQGRDPGFFIKSFNETSGLPHYYAAL